MLSIYLKEYLLNEKKLFNKSENTLRAYKKDIQQLIDFLNEDNLENLISIKEYQLKQFFLLLREKNISKRSINRKLSSAKGFFKFLFNKEYILENPTLSLEQTEFKSTLLPVLYKDEFLQIRTLLDGNSFNELRDRVIIELLYSSGIRANELLNLSEGLFNFEEREFKVAGKNERVVFYSKTAAAYLEKYIEAKKEKFGDDYRREILFVNNSQNRLSDRSLRRIVDKINSNSLLDKEISPQTFRHSFGAYMIQHGMNLHYLQELMGHSSIESTKLYLEYEEASEHLLKN